jgi:hypothetical protein
MAGHKCPTPISPEPDSSVAPEPLEGVTSKQAGQPSSRHYSVPELGSKPTPTAISMASGSPSDRRALFTASRGVSPTPTSRESSPKSWISTVTQKVEFRLGRLDVLRRVRA